jgi:tetratricopeptide (TPR) repeat protein
MTKNSNKNTKAPKQASTDNSVVVEEIQAAPFRPPSEERYSRPSSNQNKNGNGNGNNGNNKNQNNQNNQNHNKNGNSNNQNNRNKNGNGNGNSNNQNNQNNQNQNKNSNGNGNNQTNQNNVVFNFVPEEMPIVNKMLCLNMIVKNESKVILRLLASVVKYIDCYCICDTGSTDNTIDIIRNFFNSQSPPIPGKVIQEPFRDFGYNRTFALKACESLDVKYILLLDADMILQVDPSISKENFHSRLTDDVYYIFQGSETFYYKNVRVVKNKLGMSYWGVTHEYVRTPEGTVYGKLDKPDVFINDIGDGGCKADKFIRDINLLTRGLEQEPNNDRYTFYLGNSYRDAGQKDKAIEAYKRRIELGGWFDEVWHSHYNIGKCYRDLGDMPNAIYWWMEAYNYYPNRIENLYEIMHHYRCNGKNNLAYAMYTLADHERKKNTHNDYLFLQKDVYDYKLDYELSIVGYYCNFNNYDLNASCMKVLNYPHVDEGIARNVLSNYKFYTKDICGGNNLLTQQNKDILASIGKSLPEIQDSLGEYVSSTPSMCMNKDGQLVVNVRYVNYKINEQGGYENPGTIATKNVIAVLDISEEEWELKSEFILGYNTEYDNLYVGLEDIRLFVMSNESHIYFNANRGLSYHNITIEHGTIDMTKQSAFSGFISMDGQREVEKNWVLFEDANGKMKIIYNWSPLVIGDISQDKETVSTTSMSPMKFRKTHEIKNPHFFKHLRGSTNGIKMGDEIWFCCHTVSYEDRRYYYHVFVVLDASTYEVKKYTPYFTFQKEKVEYTLGFVYFDTTGELMIGYSLMDKTTEYVLLNKSVISDMLIDNV